MPGAHKSKQLSCEELPGGEVFSLSHDVHDTLPLSLLYVPASHWVQSPPSGPVYPALHVHAFGELLPLGASELAPQAKQLSVVVEAALIE